jgi:hypothetical protein
MVYTSSLLLFLAALSATASPLNKRIAQVISDSTKQWELACVKAGGAQQCNPLSVESFTNLLAAAPACGQQDSADKMVDLAKQLNNNPDMIKFAQIFAQQPRNTPNSVAVPYCQKAPRNQELNGLFQCQYQGANQKTFVGNVAVGGPGTIPFGMTKPLDPLGSCPAHPSGPIADGTQLVDTPGILVPSAQGTTPSTSTATDAATTSTATTSATDTTATSTATAAVMPNMADPYTDSTTTTTATDGSVATAGVQTVTVTVTVAPSPQAPTDTGATSATTASTMTPAAALAPTTTPAAASAPTATPAAVAQAPASGPPVAPPACVAQQKRGISSSLTIKKRIAQPDLPAVAQSWQDLCFASGGDTKTGDPCVTLAGKNGINGLLAGSDPCAQQDNADAMIDFAKSNGIKNKDALIANAIAYRKHPRNALDIGAGLIPSTPFCQRAPRNQELVGVVNGQLKGVNPGLFGGPKFAVIPFGAPGTCPFGQKPDVATCKCS